jgi:hypothetical protein
VHADGARVRVARIIEHAVEEAGRIRQPSADVRLARNLVREPLAAGYVEDARPAMLDQRLQGLLIPPGKFPDEFFRHAFRTEAESDFKPVVANRCRYFNRLETTASEDREPEGSTLRPKMWKI